MNTADTYFIKALDHYYSWDMEKAMEALGYGLAYNSEHPALLCLMGRIYSEQLNQYKTAIEYYEEALGADLNYPETYYHYLSVLFKTGQLEMADKLADHALKVQGIDKYQIYGWKSSILEQKELYQEALDMINLCRKHCYNKNASDFLEEEVARIKKKMSPDCTDNKGSEPGKKSFFEKIGIRKIEKK
jgi:tetratricopeptide (TPR) repeat protein